MAFSAQDVKAFALDLGFNLVGITSAQPSPQLNAYLRWVGQGMHGEMGYMARADRVDRRRNLTMMVTDARSLIVVGLDYATHIPANTDPSRGRIAAYAWGTDYHDVMLPRLEKLASMVSPGIHRAYVDTGAILERSHAHQAGLGFTGKNTMLIHPRRGSLFFLGEIITDVEFDQYDTPGRASLCGSCTRCLNACPTNAFPQPYVLDARRCISYLTIEYKGWIPHDLRAGIGNWVYGCDICQEVCPFQRFAQPTSEREFYPPDADFFSPSLINLLKLDDERFNRQYSQSPILRIKRERLVRNACIAAGNWASPEAVPALEALLSSKSPLIRGHAAWALGRVNTPDTHMLLERRYAQEEDHLVLREIAFALET